MKYDAARGYVVLCDGLVVMVLGQGMDEEMTTSHSRFGLSVSMAWFQPLQKKLCRAATGRRGYRCGWLDGTVGVCRTDWIAFQTPHEGFGRLLVGLYPQQLDKVLPASSVVESS